MNKFEKQLEKWNGGVLRGAQAKLAKILQVSTATVALWSTGKRHPSKGYLNQLARIFNLDVYDVTRLFLPISTYTQSYPTRSESILRDLPASLNTYSTDKFQRELVGHNSIPLPFFLQIPADLPEYKDTQVAEWWLLPRRAAQGAQFLIRAGATDVPSSQAEDILFVTPSSTWITGCVMLIQKDGKYLLRRICRHKNILKWQKDLQTPTAIPPRAKPLGIVVRKITNSIF